MTASICEYDVCSILELDSRLSALLWTVMFVSAALVITIQRQSAVLVLIGSTIVRLIVSIGLEPTLKFIGTINVCLVHCFI
jgi:hypothetical protein